MSNFIKGAVLAGAGAEVMRSRKRGRVAFTGAGSRSASAVARSRSVGARSRSTGRSVYGGGPVTTQSDFRASGSRRKSMKGRVGGRAMARARRARRRRRRFRRRIRNIVTKRSSYTFAMSWARTWLSDDDANGIAFIPFMSWMGDNAALATPGLANTAAPTGIVPGRGLYTGKMDLARPFIEAVKESNLTISAANTVSNVDTNRWWFKFTNAKLDVTISNDGSSLDIEVEVGAHDSARNIEYEVYFCWTKKRMGTLTDSSVNDTNTGDFVEVHINGNREEHIETPTAYTNAGLLNQNVEMDDVRYDFFSDPSIKYGLGVRKIGAGYLPLGAQARFRKKVRLSKVITARWFFRNVTNANFDAFVFPAGGVIQRNGFLPGLTYGLFFVWRGMPVGAESGTVDAKQVYRSRLTFTVQRWISFYSPSQNPRWGAVGDRLCDDIIFNG